MRLLPLLLPRLITMVPRQSNIDRKVLRDECRQKLASHISDRLGISISPSDVRLNPTKHEPYDWKFIPEQQEYFTRLFSKSISDHSVGAYRILLGGVGVSFEAVLSTESSSLLTNSFLVNLSRSIH